jgi:cold shock CspA family protein
MEQLAKVDIRITGKIKVIHTEKQSGWIQLLDDETQLFYFIADQLQNINFESLKEGDIVSFFINKGSSDQSALTFANCITIEYRASEICQNNDNSQKKFDFRRHVGFIKKIIPDSKKGFITLVNNNEQIDIYFMAREVQNNDFESLKVGDFVTFRMNRTTDGLKFANRIIFRFHGLIDRIFLEKNYGWIICDDLSSDNDLFFKAEQVENNQFTKLREWDKVSFRITKKDGLRFANEITLLSQRDQHFEKNTTLEIVNNNHIIYPNNYITKQINSCHDFKLNLIEYINSLIITDNTNEFEDSVFLLLRLIGINALYQYDKKNQAGKADGFFIIANLAVMYDCTLRSSFQEHKKDQIENYVNKMEGSQLSFDLRISDGKSRQKNLKIDGKSKQVWIITKNSSREITDYGNIKVKEVSVHNLVSLLKSKLDSDTIEEYDLANRLSTIENIDY